MLLAEEPPEPDIPPPGAATKPQVDWLFATVAVAVVLLFLVVYNAGSALIDRLAGRRR